MKSIEIWFSQQCNYVIVLFIRTEKHRKKNNFAFWLEEKHEME